MARFKLPQFGWIEVWKGTDDNKFSDVRRIFDEQGIKYQAREYGAASRISMFNTNDGPTRNNPRLGVNVEALDLMKYKDMKTSYSVEVQARRLGEARKALNG